MTLLSTLASLCLVALAADSIQFQPSRISYAKKRSWEALASKWMSMEDLQKHSDQQLKANKQMIFVDYNGAQFRGLFSDKIKYNGWYWYVVYSQASMAKEVASYREKGFEPSYICRLADGYTAVFVTPVQLEQARKLLDGLGIGPASLK